MNNENLLPIMEERQQVYALLARLFQKETSEDLFQALRTIDFSCLEDEALAEDLKGFKDYVRSDEASVLDLARDYAKTFCGASSTHKTSAYPFESIYTSASGLMMQEARDGAVRWYYRYGLHKSDSFCECEDHVGLELQFMAHLAALCVVALTEGDDERTGELVQAQRDFAQEHLVNWLPDFVHQVEMRASTTYYSSLAAFMLHYVRRDYESLCDLAA